MELGGLPCIPDLPKQISASAANVQPSEIGLWARRVECSVHDLACGSTTRDQLVRIGTH